MAREEMVWILQGRYNRKPGHVLGAYRTYERAKLSMDAAALCGDYDEVQIQRFTVLTGKKPPKPKRPRVGKPDGRTVTKGESK